MKQFCVKQEIVRPHFLHECGSLNSWDGMYAYTTEQQNNESIPP